MSTKFALGAFRRRGVEGRSCRDTQLRVEPVREHRAPRRRQRARGDGPFAHCAVQHEILLRETSHRAVAAREGREIKAARAHRLSHTIKRDRVVGGVVCVAARVVDDDVAQVGRARDGALDRDVLGDSRPRMHMKLGVCRIGRGEHHVERNVGTVTECTEKRLRLVGRRPRLINRVLAESNPHRTRATGSDHVGSGHRAVHREQAVFTARVAVKLVATPHPSRRALDRVGRAYEMESPDKVVALRDATTNTSTCERASSLGRLRPHIVDHCQIGAELGLERREVSQIRRLRGRGRPRAQHAFDFDLDALVGG